MWRRYLNISSLFTRSSPFLHKRTRSYIRIRHMATIAETFAQGYSHPPLHILAVRLAYVTALGGVWIVLSYAKNRFPFLPPYPARIDDGRVPQDLDNSGFVHPKWLWYLERKEDIEAHQQREPRESDTKSLDLVHRPSITCTLYVLRKTDRKLYLSKVGALHCV